MPLTTPTIVRDLYYNTSRGVKGANWAAQTGRAHAQRGTLDAHRCVRELAIPIVVSSNGLGPNHFFDVVSAPLPNANGFCLLFEDDMSTVATLTRAQRIVVSADYSGCLYSVYSVGGGTYKCVHTARPGGHYADAYVQALRAFAQRQNWVLMHEVPTRADGVSGAGINGCNGTTIVTRISYSVAPNPEVRTVRLRVDSQGNSVHRARWRTVTGGATVVD